jgi:hypothetical protein
MNPWMTSERNSAGQASEWTEESQGTGPTDQRPAYKLVYLSGPYKLLGNDGRLRLTFYNGQLMETEFTPQKNDENYLNALRNEIPKMPRKPSEEIVIDRRTRFRFDMAPNGEVSFTWYDPKLERQWKEWVAKNS